MAAVPPLTPPPDAMRRPSSKINFDAGTPPIVTDEPIPGRSPQNDNRVLSEVADRIKAGKEDFRDPKTNEVGVNVYGPQGAVNYQVWSRVADKTGTVEIQMMTAATATEATVHSAGTVRSEEGTEFIRGAGPGLQAVAAATRQTFGITPAPYNGPAFTKPAAP